MKIHKSSAIVPKINAKDANVIGTVELNKVVMVLLFWVSN